MAFKKNEKIWFWNHGTEFHLEYVGKYDDIVSWICEPSARMNWNQWAICNWWKSTGSWKLLLVADILQSNYQQDWQNNMKYYDIASNYTWIGLLDFKNLYSYIYTYNHGYIFIIRWWFHNKKMGGFAFQKRYGHPGGPRAPRLPVHDAGSQSRWQWVRRYLKSRVDYAYICLLCMF
jgi:hypothetical protein